MRGVRRVDNYGRVFEFVAFGSGGAPATAADADDDNDAAATGTTATGGDGGDDDAGDDAAAGVRAATTFEWASGDDDAAAGISTRDGASVDYYCVCLSARRLKYTIRAKPKRLEFNNNKVS